MTIIGLDDRDPHISYWPGGWFPGGGDGFEYNATTTGSNTTGDVASLTFTGKNVSVWGTVNPDTGGVLAPTSAYIVDNLPAVTFIPALQPVSQHLQIFFQSDELSPSTSHTLVIKNIGPKNSTLWLDYIQITPPDSVDAVLFSAPTPSSTSSSPLPSTPTPSAIPRPGVIVGATLGSLTTLAIFALVTVLYLRARSRHHNELTVPRQQIQSSTQFSSVNIGEQPPQYQDHAGYSPTRPNPTQSSAGIPVSYARDHLPSSKVLPLIASGSSN
ncbi:hypothetical protein GALMADRAFT_156054 [Galerina marginata CBS 339.88]|uniref:Uncharacterized protein n=1 Tax=Galerina marginata (strain CBS 339.88) TaxID=685588 RepID=A0A067TC30_GALM3|nr:hypothetical protein GALMADRAFT_156054 [Galerina marginata CBS 339.88]